MALAPGSSPVRMPDLPTSSRETPSGRPSPSLVCMRAVQIIRFGGPEVLDVVDIPEPEPGPGHELYDVSTAGINFADTHHRPSRN
jgi:hypothetical protein